MSPSWVIESLDVFEDCGGGRFVCWEYLIAEPFAFQAAEEAFYGGVVPAVAFTTHAALHLKQVERLSVALGGVLRTSVGVMQ